MGFETLPSMALSVAVSLLQSFVAGGHVIDSINVKLFLHASNEEKEGINFHFGEVTANATKLSDIETIKKYGDIVELDVFFEDYASVTIKLVGSRIDLRGLSIAEVAATGVELKRIESITFH